MKSINDCEVRISFLKGRINRYSSDVERAKTMPVISQKAIMMVERMIERDKAELFQTEELVKVMRIKGEK